MVCSHIVLTFLATTPLVTPNYFNKFCKPNEYDVRCPFEPEVSTGVCIPQPVCDPSAKYRTYDGSCNNLNHTSWGQANSPFIRLLPAVYDDGVSVPRKSVTGEELPQPRKISETYFRPLRCQSKIYTYNLMQFGQLGVAHDTTHVLNRQTDDKKEFQCCTVNNEVPPADILPNACLPMPVDQEDCFYSQFGVRCLTFTRAKIVSESVSCESRSIQTLNSVTHFMDANEVYGNDKDTAYSLRSLSKGQLRVQTTMDGRKFPPNSNNPDVDCTNPPNETICYTAGDDRVNQNSGITMYQVMLLRLHNIFCEILHGINPHWNDEKLYQEARRIVWAVLQYITYNHYLPIIIGKEFMIKNGLLVENSCKCINYYDPNVNPSTFNEYGGAAFRLFHTTAPDYLSKITENGQFKGKVCQFDHYFRPSFVQEPGNFDLLINGMFRQHMEAVDNYFTIAVTGYLYKAPDKDFGNDLESTDIQRGRDLGLPTYNQMRVYCGLKRAYIFNDFLDVMPCENVERLKLLYLSPDDVDLFVGGVMESPLEGIISGPTVQCIIGKQFYHYMKGDRFFYQNCGPPWAFTKDQVRSISSISLSRIFCDTGDNLKFITRDTFYIPSERNPIVPCSAIPPIDLSAWKE